MVVGVTRGRPATVRPSVLLAGLLPGLLVALAGCGGGGTGPAAAGSPTDGSTAPTPVATVPTEADMDRPSDEPEPLDPSSTSAVPLDPPGTGPGPGTLPTDPVGAELVLVVGGPTGDRPPVVLGCDFAAGTATGDHPQAARACTDLLAALQGGDPFTPVPPDAICTQVFGGDAVVTVTGAVLAADGAPVDVQARFALTDGCEIGRWQAMGAVLSPYGGAAGVTG